MSENYSTMKKEELIESLQKKDEELNSVKSDIDSLKAMFLTMQEAQKLEKESDKVAVAPQQIIIPSTDEEMVQMGSNLIGLHILRNSSGDEVIELNDFGDIASVSSRVLDSIMTPENKRLLREGLIYFLDDKWYNRHSIKKDTILNEEMIDKIYALPIQEMFKEIDKLTNCGINDKVKYTIYWAIVKNVAIGKKGYADRNKEIELSTYFKADISNSINLLNCAKELHYK